MKFDNILIVSDIDGTFLDDESNIVDRNIDALNYFKENGGLFTYATGRSECNIDPDIIKLANAPLICNNGAYIYDPETGKKHNEICMAPGPFISVLKTIFSTFPGLGVRINAGEKAYVLGEGDGFVKGAVKPYIAPDFMQFTDLENMPSENWYKAVVYGEADKLELAAKYIRVAAENHYQIAASSPTLLELCNIRATKGLAAQLLKHNMETKLGKLMMYGIGDYENDIELLKHADAPICPSNALPSVKDFAETIVCSNVDGAVAGLIEYIDSNT